MLPRTRWLLMPALLTIWLGLAGTASAVFPPPIKDEAKLFSAEAIDKANKKIKEIYSTSKKDLIIETYPSVPEGKTLPDDAKKRGEFFKEWARARAKESGANGVYVLICKSPGRVQITVDDDTAKKAFRAKDLSALDKKLIEAFKAKKFDEGLVEAVDLVAAALKANLK
jgi:uncharacterized membrane protein YgcG